MDWEFIVCLILAIPIILLPVAFVWYLNLGGIISAVRGLWRKRAARQKRSAAEATAKADRPTSDHRV